MNAKRIYRLYTEEGLIVRTKTVCERLGEAGFHRLWRGDRTKPVENGFIESFNGCLRDECLNVEVFFTLEDVREKLMRWREDYNYQRPHRSLQDKTPVAFAADWSVMTQREPATPELPRHSRQLC